MPNTSHVTPRIILALALAAGACVSDPAEPMWYTPPSASVDAVPGVTLSVAIDPSVTSHTDSVRFVATATNSTAQRIQLGEACGPAMDVIVTLPDGQRRSVLLDRTGPDVAFTCELGPHHFVEPHSEQTLVMSWSIRGREFDGTYTAAAGLRRSDGLGNLSAPVTFRK